MKDAAASSPCDGIFVQPQSECPAVIHWLMLMVKIWQWLRYGTIQKYILKNLVWLMVP
jgi:hypothetical protein